MTRKRVGFAAAAAVVGGATAALVVTNNGSGPTTNLSAATPVLPLTVQSESTKQLTLTWSPPAGAEGYVFMRDNTRISNTWDPAKTTIRFSKPSGQHTYGVEAVGAVAAGQVTSPPPITTTTPTTTTVPTGTAAVYVADNGNDATCERGTTKPCETPNRAYRIANGGDTIMVAGGVYGWLSDRGGRINPDPSKTGPVTFTCQGPVDFATSIFYFAPGLNGVTMRGDCFHFHVPYFGLGGSPARTNGITLDGVHMESFNILGASNITISNSEIGPFVACYAPGNVENTPAYTYCDPSSPAEEFWADRGGTVVQQEPFIHSGSAGTATNILLLNDRIHGITSRWSGTHTGGLLVWDTDRLTIKDTVFDHNAIYNIEFNATSHETNGRYEGNQFGPSVYSLDPSSGKPGAPLIDAQCQDGMGGTGAVQSSFTNLTWQGNYFDQCVILGGGFGTYANVTVRDNTVRGYATCPATSGIVFSGNKRTDGTPICG